MALSDSDITALASELTTDPETLGYTDNNGEAVEILNLVRAGAPYVVNVAETAAAGDVAGGVSTQDIVDATDQGEYGALTAAEQRFYLALVSREVVVLTAATKSHFTSLFGAGTATRTALVALTTRQGSRAEVLFGQNVNIDDIRKARA